jgi:putative phosphoesterase
MQIGVISDTHDRSAEIQKAIALLAERGIRLLLHCGDIESVATVRLFAAFQTHYVLGNWDGDWIAGVNCGWAPLAADGRRRDATRLRKAIAESGGRLHEPWGELEVAGRQIAWTHGNDRSLLKEIERSGCYDFLFYGHTHVAESHRTGGTLVVNPGALFKVHPLTFAVLDLESGEVDSVPIR